VNTKTEYKLPFEKLQTWHMAKDFAKRIYEATGQFPPSQQYGLTSQMQRAAVSVMSNIAEGSARTSRKDQAHFSQLAYSSLMEAACQLHLAQEIGFVSVDEYNDLRETIMELSVKINALRRSQLKTHSASDA
jgi:four helix bundle protein